MYFWLTPPPKKNCKNNYYGYFIYIFKVNELGGGGDSPLEHNAMRIGIYLQEK